MQKRFTGNPQMCGTFAQPTIERHGWQHGDAGLSEIMYIRAKHSRIEPKNSTIMAKAIKYFGNDWENAVVKVMDNGERYVRFFHDLAEFRAHPGSGVAFGGVDNHLEEIPEEDYETFGRTWNYGGRGCERTEWAEHVTQRTIHAFLERDGTEVLYFCNKVGFSFGGSSFAQQAFRVETDGRTYCKDRGGKEKEERSPSRSVTNTVLDKDYEFIDRETYGNW